MQQLKKTGSQNVTQAGGEAVECESVSGNQGEKTEKEALEAYPG